MALNGYDISAYQGTLDVATVPADFVTIKATGGDGYVNPNLRTQLAAAKAAGRLTGIYHFARDGYTAATAASEAAWFIKNAGDLCDGTNIIVLDWEGDNVGDVAYAKAWLDTVHAQTGVKPIIYLSYDTITTHDWSAIANADYGCWEAAYVLGYQQVNGYNPPSGRATIPYWNSICEWQYTSSGRLPGWPNDLDLDQFYGDATTWAAYAAKNGTPNTNPNVTPQEDIVATIDDLKTAITDPAVLTAIAKAVQTYRVPHLDPATGKDDGIGTTLAAVEGAFDLQNVATRNAVQAEESDLKAAISAVGQVTLTDAQVANLADLLVKKLPPAQITALAAQLQK